MSHLQVTLTTAEAAASAARIRIHRRQLRRAHARAVARAAEIAAREPHLISIFALGEVISQIEADQIHHAQSKDFAESAILHRVIARLQTLIPA
jgi:hypothetical protein